MASLSFFLYSPAIFLHLVFPLLSWADVSVVCTDVVGFSGKALLMKLLPKYLNPLLFVPIIAACGVSNNSALDAQAPAADSSASPYVTGKSNDKILERFADHVQEPGFLVNLGNFSTALGFGWAQGCPFYSGWNEEKTEFSLIQDHSDLSKCDSDPKGFWADKRTSYKFTNLQNNIKDITFGELEISDISKLKPVSGGKYISKNLSDSEGSNADFSYTRSKRTILSTNSSKTVGSSVSMGSSLSIALEVAAKVEGSGFSLTNTFTTTFAKEFNKSMTNGESKANWDAETFNFRQSVPIPPCSKRTVELLVYSVEYKIPYTATVETTSKVDVTGFLRWSFHAHRNKGNDRPTITATFGDNEHGIGESISLMVHANHGNNLDWDWEKVRSKYPLDSILTSLDANSKPLKTEVTGEIVLRQQSLVEMVAGKTEKLDSSSCSAGGSLSRSLINTTEGVL